MMYFCYMSGILMPVAPSKINTKINNKNKTITLINEGEVNILKQPGLQEISFEILIPAVKYPFARYLISFMPIAYYLQILRLLKERAKPFQFIIIREGTLGSIGFDTNLKVSLEDYQIIENADNGRDVVVSIRLKEYKEKQNLLARDIKLEDGTTGIKLEKVRESTNIIDKVYKIKPGETLYQICKKYLGDGEKFREIAKLNSLSNFNSIDVGQVIRFE